MSMFPETSLTLLQKLVTKVSGESEQAWVRFFALYTPVMRRFVEMNDHVHDPDDVIQDVYVKIVEIVREGRYDAKKARFRTFLAMLIRHQLISLYRRDLARREDAKVRTDAIDGEVRVEADQGNALDLAWAAAKHAAAVEHVLRKTALSKQSRDVYSALSKDGRTISEVASAFGISENLVRQIKFRVEQRIGIVEAEMVEDERVV